MQLPGAGDGEVARLELVIFIVNNKGAGAGFHQTDFDAFVAMGFQPPIGFASGALQKPMLLSPGRIFVERACRDSDLCSGREIRFCLRERRGSAVHGCRYRNFADDLDSAAAGKRHGCSISFAEWIWQVQPGSAGRFTGRIFSGLEYVVAPGRTPPRQTYKRQLLLRLQASKNCWLPVVGAVNGDVGGTVVVQPRPGGIGGLEQHSGTAPGDHDLADGLTEMASGPGGVYNSGTSQCRALAGR